MELDLELLLISSYVLVFYIYNFFLITCSRLSSPPRLLTPAKLSYHIVSLHPAMYSCIVYKSSPEVFL